MYQAHRLYHYGNLQSGPGFFVPPAGVNMGFNFRATSGFVTDGAQVYVLPADTYPTTRGGFTFGWVIVNNAVFGVDRSTGVDVRLAGINYTAGFNGTGLLANTYFRVDLPAVGSYNIHLAMGDTFNQSGVAMRAEIRDTTTDLTFVVSGTPSAGHQWRDAAGTLLTDTTWPTSEVGVSKTFASTQLRLYAGNLTGTDITTMAHLRINQ